MRSKACVVAAVALLAACGGPIPKTHFYVLHLPAAPQQQSRQPAPYTLAVMPFRAPDQLEQDRIVFRPSAVEVDFYEYHRWAERPASMITNALLDRLRAQGLFASVVPFDGRAKADYLLLGRLERLEEVDAPGSVNVRVEMEAEVLDVKKNRTVWNGSASHSGPVEEGEVRAVVAEISRGVDACLGQLASGLEGFAKALPPPPAPTSSGSR